ncbi:hypothetical protein KJ359_012908 [Pestalotiopsis sp. 9143b]|nr:hypothetical protein KJ359_012908 [Pestalotiopsis sp. 9143b]
MTRQHKDRKESSSDPSGGASIPAPEPTSSDSWEAIQEDCNVQEKDQATMMHRKEPSTGVKVDGRSGLPAPARTHISHTRYRARLPLQAIPNHEQAISVRGSHDLQLQPPPHASLDSKLSHIARTLRRELERTLTSGRIKDRQRGVFRQMFEQVNEAARMMDDLRAPLTPAQRRLARQVRTVMKEVGALLFEYSDLNRAAQENRRLA